MNLSILTVKVKPYMYNGIVTGLHLWSLLNRYEFVGAKINSHKIEKK